MATKERTYTEAEIADKLRDLPGWYFEDGWIRRVYKTDGWPTTLMLVGARASEVLRRLPDRFARHRRRVVDLREDLDVPRAVIVYECGPAEVLGNLAQILRAFLHGTAELLHQHVDVAFAQPGNHHTVGAVSRSKVGPNP